MEKKLLLKSIFSFSRVSPPCLLVICRLRQEPLYLPFLLDARATALRFPGRFIHQSGKEEEEEEGPSSSPPPLILGWSSICLSQVVKTTVDRRCSWGSPLLSALMATPVSILKQKVGFQSLRGKLFDVDTAFQAHVCPIASFSWSISWGWLHCATKTFSSKPSRPSTCFDNYHLSV